MAKPFDVTTKHLIEAHPEDWLAFLGRPATQLRIIDADLATITSEADKVILVEEPYLEIVHFDLQAGYDLEFVERIWEYNVLLSRKHKRPVRTVAVLLRPEADRPSMAVTGYLELWLGDGTRNHEFVFDVVRVWEQPVEVLLNGGLGTLPLAPISDVAQEALPEVIRAMETQIEAEASPDEVGELWTATYILMGLKYEEAFTSQLLRGVRAMKESVTYQAILEEGEARGRAEGEARGRAEGEARGRAEGEARGRAEEARELLLLIGSKRLGDPDATTRATMDSIQEVAQLKGLCSRVLDVESWSELLR